MIFNIYAFTDKGFLRDKNEDYILVQGEIYNNRFFSLENQKDVFCFVADGVGGSQSGDIASEFLLKKLIECLYIRQDLNDKVIFDTLKRINLELIELSNSELSLKGMASTLSGMIIRNGMCFIINAGDSSVWVLRNKIFYRATKEHVINFGEFNKPISSYFGGQSDNLTIDLEGSLREVKNRDRYFITSDGISKLFSQEELKTLLSAQPCGKTILEELYNLAIDRKCDDNISCILIEAIDQNEE